MLGDSHWKFVETASNAGINGDIWLASFVSRGGHARSRDVSVEGDYSLIDELSFCCRLEHTQKRRDRKWKAGSPFGRTKIRRRAPAVRWVPVCLFVRLSRPTVPSVRRYLMAKLSSPVRKIDGPGDRRFFANTCKEWERINGGDRWRTNGRRYREEKKYIERICSVWGGKFISGNLSFQCGKCALELTRKLFTKFPRARKDFNFLNGEEIFLRRFPSCQRHAELVISADI